jgi:hypothetical protein
VLVPLTSGAVVALDRQTGMPLTSAPESKGDGRPVIESATATADGRVVYVVTVDLAGGRTVAAYTRK